MYIWRYDDAVGARDAASLKATCYSTVIYSPAAPLVDFGIPTWPPTLFKKDLSPRMLLVSTWTDGRWGFVGGGAKKGECPLRAINREFLEETGAAVEFTPSDFCFASTDEKAAVFVFCRVTSDLQFFNKMLAGFYLTERRAYPDEVLAITGYPIWMEGPPSVSETCWEKQIHGLPRHLVSNGGLMTPTFGNTNIPRLHMILVLYLRKFISKSDLQRVFDLSTHFDSDGDRPLPPFEEVWGVICSDTNSDNSAKRDEDTSDSDIKAKIPRIG